MPLPCFPLPAPSPHPAPPAFHSHQTRQDKVEFEHGRLGEVLQKVDDFTRTKESYSRTYRHPKPAPSSATYHAQPSYSAKGTGRSTATSSMTGTGTGAGTGAGVDGLRRTAGEVPIELLRAAAAAAADELPESIVDLLRTRREQVSPTSDVTFPQAHNEHDEHGDDFKSEVDEYPREEEEEEEDPDELVLARVMCPATTTPTESGRVTPVVDSGAADPAAAAAAIMSEIDRVLTSAVDEKAKAKVQSRVEKEAAILLEARQQAMSQAQALGLMPTRMKSRQQARAGGMAASTTTATPAEAAVDTASMMPSRTTWSDLPSHVPAHMAFEPPVPPVPHAPHAHAYADDRAANQSYARHHGAQLYTPLVDGDWTGARQEEAQPRPHLEAAVRSRSEAGAADRRCSPHREGETFRGGTRSKARDRYLESARQRVRQRDGRSPDQHASGSGNGNRNGNGNGNERRSGSGNAVGEGREPDPVNRGGWEGSVEMVYSSVLVDEMRKRLPLPQVSCAHGHFTPF